jgi:hypothetical protein
MSLDRSIERYRLRAEFVLQVESQGFSLREYDTQSPDAAVLGVDVGILLVAIGTSNPLPAGALEFDNHPLADPLPARPSTQALLPLPENRCWTP